MPRSTCATVLIPAYNSEATIGAVVGQVRAQGLRVLVVDDGSSDDTGPRAHQAGAALITLPRNRGKGFALVAGFRRLMQQGDDLVVTMDADGQHRPADLPQLLERAMAGAHLVVGRRRITLEEMPRASFAGNCISTFWISLFCGCQFPDTQCGYRVYSRHLLQSVPLRGGRFETETELLMRAHLLGLSIAWVPIATIYDNGVTPHSTHFDNWIDPLRVIAVVLRSPRFPRGGRS